MPARDDVVLILVTIGSQLGRYLTARTEPVRWIGDFATGTALGSAASACLPGAGFVDDATAQGWLDLIPNATPSVEAVAAMRGSDALLLLQSQ